MQNTGPPLLIILAFVIIFPILWIGIVLLIARLGGWIKLAKLFPATQERSGEVCGYASARFRMFVGYSRCLTITVSQSGIHMRPMLAFRIGHDPIFIPWDAVQDIRQKGLALFPVLDMQVQLPDAAGTITISFFGRRLVETLARYGAARHTPK